MLVAVLDQVVCARQVLLLLVMAHIHHNTIELPRRDSRPDRIRALRVVEMQRHRDFRGAAGFGRGGDEEAVGVGEGPGEEEDLAGGGAGFGGGFDGGDGLEVVAADAGDAVVAFGGGGEDLDGDVVLEFAEHGGWWWGGSHYDDDGFGGGSDLKVSLDV